jgi:hypothetical protein
MKKSVSKFCCIIISISSVALLRCSLEPLSGGGTIETTNGRITGQLVNSTGSISEGTQVIAIPNHYNPITDGAISGHLFDTTDNRGVYLISGLAPGTYNIQATSLKDHTRALICSLYVADTTVRRPIDTLKMTGAISVILSSDVNHTDGYLYIPGTTIAVRLNTFGDSDTIRIDSVPATTIPSLVYSVNNDSAEKRTVRQNIFIAPGKTTEIADLHSWKFSMNIFLNTRASGANVAGDVTNFPVLVRLTNSNFVFSQAKGGGEDIRFTKSDGSPLPYEIESWDSSQGSAGARAEIWVKVDTVYGNDSTHYIVMNWGNAASGSASSGTAVFDTANGFKAVLHFNSGYSDVTNGHHNGVGYGVTDTAGMIGGAGRFHGHDSVSIAGLLDSLQDMTMSAWAELDTADAKGSEIISIGDIAVLRMDDIGSVDGSGTRASFRSASALRVVNSGQYFAKTGWHHVAYTIDRKRSIQSLYLDGVLCCFTGFAEPVDYSGWGRNTVIGNHGNGSTGYGFSGAIDEVRISNVPRSADWLKLCSMNQRAGDRLVVFK